jgi:TfoX N-terminal domain
VTPNARDNVSLHRPSPSPPVLPLPQHRCLLLGDTDNDLCRSPARPPGTTSVRSQQVDERASVRLAGMAYDTELVDRIRFLIGTGPDVSETKMFGGLAFLVRGNMAISASGQGGVLVRVDPAETSALVATANATLAVMGGRTMHGWLRVSSEDLEADEQLTEWVNRAVGYARSLPPKR